MFTALLFDEITSSGFGVTINSTRDSKVNASPVSFLITLLFLVLLVDPLLFFGWALPQLAHLRPWIVSENDFLHFPHRVLSVLRLRAVLLRRDTDVSVLADAVWLVPRDSIPYLGGNPSG